MRAGRYPAAGGMLPHTGEMGPAPLVRTGPKSESEPWPDLVLANPAIELGKFMFEADRAAWSHCNFLRRALALTMNTWVRVDRQTAPM